MEKSLMTPPKDSFYWFLAFPPLIGWALIFQALSSLSDKPTEECNSFNMVWGLFMGTSILLGFYYLGIHDETILGVQVRYIPFLGTLACMIVGGVWPLVVLMVGLPEFLSWLSASSLSDAGIAFFGYYIIYIASVFIAAYFSAKEETTKD